MLINHDPKILFGSMLAIEKCNSCEHSNVLLNQSEGDKKIFVDIFAACEALVKLLKGPSGAYLDMTQRGRCREENFFIVNFATRSPL